MQVDSWGDDFGRDTMLDTAVSTAPPKNVWDDYPAWLAKGKKLAFEHNNRNWRLGDCLLEGDEYNLQNLGIESHLLIGSHPPNFWKQVSGEVDLAVGTLKNLALVSRRFPQDKRVGNLSWSHHQIAAPYERANEYLLACVDDTGKKIHNVEWLRQHIETMDEGKSEAGEERKSIPLCLPVALIAKLKDVAKHYGKSPDEVAYDACAMAVYGYLRKQQGEISMGMFGVYDQDAGWPLAPGVIARYCKRYKSCKRKFRAAD